MSINVSFYFDVKIHISNRDNTDDKDDLIQSLSCFQKKKKLYNSLLAWSRSAVQCQPIFLYH